jgi:hypothetical protein
MSYSSYQYFTIPLSSVPDAPSFQYVWFATWSDATSSFVWSKTRPAAGTMGTTPTYVCGATTSAVPAGATVIIPASGKVIDPLPIVAPFTTTESEFRTALQQQLIRQLDGKRSL